MRTKHGGWVGPKVNNFVQVSRDGHQMSLSGDTMSDVLGTRAGGPCLMFLEGVGCSEVKCIRGNGYIGTPLPWTDMSDMSDNITLPARHR